MKAKAVIIIVIILAAVLIIVFGVKRQETKPISGVQIQETIPSRAIVGLDAPELVVGDPSGKAVRLSELKGTVVFVNFWATWCPPCKEEMPSIQTLYKQLKDQKGFRMVTILYRDDYQKAMAYLKDNNYDLPVVLDIDGKTAMSYGVTGVPETYIVDKKGILRERMIGPFDWASPQAVARISDMMRQ